MVKRISLCMIVIIIFSLVACASQTETGETNSAQATVKIKPSPTPQRTLSEEEITAVKEYNELMGYCESYNDWYAAVQINEMLNMGQISEEDYNRLFSISSFKDAKDFDDDLWTQVKEHLESISDILNGQTQGLSESDKENCFQYLCEASRNGTVYISLLDLEEKRDRVIQGIAYINNWLKEQSEENFDKIKEYYFSEELTSGEVLLLCCHIYYYGKVQEEDSNNFLDEQGIMEYAKELLDAL